jgi:hypothetical protein
MDPFAPHHEHKKIKTEGMASIPAFGALRNTEGVWLGGRRGSKNFDSL